MRCIILAGWLWLVSVPVLCFASNSVKRSFLVSSCMVLLAVSNAASSLSFVACNCSLAACNSLHLAFAIANAWLMVSNASLLFIGSVVL